MKILLSFAIIGVFVFNSFGSPLVFKATKEIKNANASNFADLFTFDASKYKQIRIALERRNIGSGEQEQARGFRVYAIEENSDVFLQWFEGYSAVIDAPPSKIKIKVNDAGLYKIYVWAE